MITVLCGRGERPVDVDDLAGDRGQGLGQAAQAAHHGDVDAACRQVGGGLAEPAVAGPDHHVTEPGGDVLVLKHVDELKVGPVLT